ncbi:MAG: DUF4388 domain-containing protein [Acidobacteria bacterium]|nr:DUF4388 domain-containing protein [Acidobacteriota bacterium]
MALEGSLRDFDLFSLFNMIKIQGKSGTLVLSRGQEFVKVFFDQGEIVGCDSNQVRMEDRVGAMLVRLGRLTGDELLTVVKVQRQTLKRMGTLLLESGKVAPQDLQDALFNQAMAIIYRTFRWMEGDYRFEAMLPMDLDREHFPPIPVDTVLMEAARIQDEWPEVQKRLPAMEVPLAQTEQARAMHLDIHQDLSGILEGQNASMTGSSGLTHEQETVLTYFAETQSIQDALQISRYEELDTCKTIADLLEMGLLAVARGEVSRAQRPWISAIPQIHEMEEEQAPSPLLWPLLAALILLPLLLYVPHARGSLNMNLASLQPVDVRAVPDLSTRLRQAWALRLAQPRDGGLGLSEALGIPLGLDRNPVGDLLRLPDPMLHPPPPVAPPPATAQPAPAPAVPAS